MNLFSVFRCSSSGWFMGFMRYKSQKWRDRFANISSLYRCYHHSLGVIQTIKGYRLHQQNKVTQEESSKVSYQRLLLTAALIFCCIFFTESLGFVISCAIYIFLQTLVLLPRKKKRNYPLFAVVAFVVSSSIFFLFRFGFDILLPAGVMGALLWLTLQGW